MPSIKEIAFKSGAFQHFNGLKILNIQWTTISRFEKEAYKINDQTTPSLIWFHRCNSTSSF